MRPKVRMDIEEEEAAIQRGIAADPDNPESTEQDFARAVPFREMFAEQYADWVEGGRKPLTLKPTSFPLRKTSR